MQDLGTAPKAPLVKARARISILVLFASPALALAVSGCVAYEPKPVRPSEIATARPALVVNPADVRRRIADLAPARASRPLTWDRLSLFAAATIYNPDIATARAGVVTNRASAAVARQWPNSMLTLTAEYANDPATGSPWLFGGSIELPLDLGARRSSRAVVADLAILAASYDVAETTWAARMALRQGLSDRLIADRKIGVLTALADLRQRQLAAIERRVASGEVSRAELERVRADVADIARRLEDQQAARRTADRAMAAVVGVPLQALEGFGIEWRAFDAPAQDPEELVTPKLRLEALRSGADVLKAVKPGYGGGSHHRRGCSAS
jgi:CRISPR system Cascade subunit CasA